MKFIPKEPPRSFLVGRKKDVEIHDCGMIDLSADEQVTFVTANGGELDVTRKAWGFYATPSLNKRLPEFGLRAVLTKNADDRFFLLLVEKGKEAYFAKYCDTEGLSVVTWMDETNLLNRIGNG